MMDPLRSPRYYDLHTDHRETMRNDLTVSESADEPLMSPETGDSEKAWSDVTAADPQLIKSGRKSRLRRIWAAVMTGRSILDTVLLLIVLGLLLERSGGLHKEEVPTPEGTPQLESGGDITGFAPRISQQIKTFAPDPMYIPENGSEFFTEAVRQKWLGIVPKGLGYVRINETKAYDNLPTPLQEYPNSTFTTSMTHQLHCLHAIVGVVAAYTSNQPDKIPEEGAWHLSHCFEYLRQSIMCSGDLALEGQQTTFPAGFKGSDGWDAKHVCKDYGQILGYLEANRANDEVWI
ncbi:hypothetical protein B0H63DRAFT_519395 [Podospora didyma]|uniref:Oxidase ustYa n=1 Tax=Podospora didyma TaxID=330526 RepID=A0AAE0NYQ7_9PEZI|nr:hypothetical protein B0H63DRAFT_519395 [Podospora didyma]